MHIIKLLKSYIIPPNKQHKTDRQSLPDSDLCVEIRSIMDVICDPSVWSVVTVDSGCIIMYKGTEFAEVKHADDKVMYRILSIPYTYQPLNIIDPISVVEKPVDAVCEIIAILISINESYVLFNKSGIPDRNLMIIDFNQLPKIKATHIKNTEVWRSSRTVVSMGRTWSIITITDELHDYFKNYMNTDGV